MISGGTKINYQLSSDDNESQHDSPSPFDQKPPLFIAQKRQDIGLHLVNQGAGGQESKAELSEADKEVPHSQLKLNLDFKQADLSPKPAQVDEQQHKSSQPGNHVQKKANINNIEPDQVSFRSSSDEESRPQRKKEFAT